MTKVLLLHVLRRERNDHCYDANLNILATALSVSVGWLDGKEVFSKVRGSGMT